MFRFSSRYTKLLRTGVTPYLGYFAHRDHWRSSHWFHLQERRSSLVTPIIKEEKRKPAELLKQSDWRRMWDIVLTQRRLLIEGLGWMAISTAITISVPAAFGQIVDVALGQSNYQLGQLLPALGIIFCVGGVATARRIWCFRLAGHNVVRDLRTEAYQSILKMEVTFFDKNRVGDLITRLSTDTFIVGQALAGLHAAELLRGSTQFLCSFGIMFYLSPELCKIVLLTVPVGVVGSIVFGKFVQKTQDQMQEALGQSSNVAEERLSQIRTIKAFAKESIEIDRYAKEVMNVWDRSVLQVMGSSIFFGTAGAIGNLLMMGTLGYGAHLVQLGTITGGTLTSFLMYTIFTAMASMGLSSCFTEIMKGLGASTRVFEVIDCARARPEDSTRTLSLPRGELTINSVNFNYPTRPEVDIFTSFNAHFPAGGKYAIVGESGSGKSSAFSLLLRFYDPSQGEIFFDGVDIKELDPNWLRRQIAIVPQEPALFSGSILDNITYSLDDPHNFSMDDVIKAATEANAHSFITNLPDGYNTQAGERGMSFSGGQRQRIAIARALLKDPKILLLDEATSALDAENEGMVAEAIQRASRGRTSIVIAHRLSTVADSENIFVLRDGTFVEAGTHQELISDPNSFYNQLTRRQSFLG